MHLYSARHPLQKNHCYYLYVWLCLWCLLWQYFCNLDLELKFIYLFYSYFEILQLTILLFILDVTEYEYFLCFDYLSHSFDFRSWFYYYFLFWMFNELHYYSRFNLHDKMSAKRLKDHWLHFHFQTISCLSNENYLVVSGTSFN